MIRALHNQQLALLEVQDLDTKAARLAFERRSLPVHQELKDLAAGRQACGQVQTRLRIELSEAERQLRQAEADVEQVRTRMSRHSGRLDSGTVAAKEAQALLGELELLKARRALLEDAEMEAMERVEAIETGISDAASRLAEIESCEADLLAHLERETERLDRDAAALAEAREALTVALPAELLGLYEEVRARTGGIGAVALRGRVVEGMAIDLPLTELEAIRNAPDDAVITSEEDGYILVRIA